MKKYLKYTLYILYILVFCLIIKYSKHAREKMAERGISEDEVVEGIKCGAKVLQKPNKILSNHKYFCVVYKKVGGVCFVITVMTRW